VIERSVDWGVGDCRALQWTLSVECSAMMSGSLSLRTCQPVRLTDSLTRLTDVILLVIVSTAATMAVCLLTTQHTLIARAVKRMRYTPSLCCYLLMLG